MEKEKALHELEKKQKEEERARQIEEMAHTLISQWEQQPTIEESDEDETTSKKVYFLLLLLFFLFNFSYSLSYHFFFLIN